MRRFLPAFLLLAFLSIMSAPLAYCTPADVADEYGEQHVIERAEVDTGAFDPDDDADPVTQKVQRQIDGAASEINAAVRARYGQLPFTAEHPFLKRLNVQLAYIGLFSVKRGGLDETGERQQERLDKQLIKISDGRLDLGDADGGTDETGDDGNPTAFRSGPRLFGAHRW